MPWKNDQSGMELMLISLRIKFARFVVDCAHADHHLANHAREMKSIISQQIICPCVARRDGCYAIITDKFTERAKAVDKLQYVEQYNDLMSGFRQLS